MAKFIKIENGFNSLKNERNVSPPTKYEQLRSDSHYNFYTFEWIVYIYVWGHTCV